MSDPVISNPEHYRLLWENELVRVLEYTDVPGDATTPHSHPNSVMVTLSSFRRTLSSEGRTRDVELSAGQAVWLAAQEHAGTNIGDTPTHTIFIELKGAAAGIPGDVAALGPDRS
jgi:beta-alanine degradation protein BauB